jgi:quinol monooxygenase YgiN
VTDRASGGFAIPVALDVVEDGLPELLLLVGENAALSVAREPGCLRFDVLTPLDGGTAGVLLYEIYTDADAFDRHLQSQHYLDFDRRSQALVRRKSVTRFSVAQNAKADGSA